MELLITLNYYQYLMKIIFIKNISFKLIYVNNLKIYIIFLIGDWGLGIGDWGLGIGPNPQSPIPNPQSPNIFYIL